MSEKNWTRCPKCQCEIRKVSAAGVEFEECPNCSGMYFDVEEVRNAEISAEHLLPGPARRDAEDLDRMEIECPKCHHSMKKQRTGAKAKFFLDVCPSCKGVWFDRAEYHHYRGGFAEFICQPEKVKFKILCLSCGADVKLDRSALAVSRLPDCPNCGGALGLMTVGELAGFRWTKNVTAAFLFVAGLFVFYGLCRLLTEPKDAILMAGTIGGMGLFLIIRALIYNRFAISLHNGHFGIVRDFEV